MRRGLAHLEDLYQEILCHWRTMVLYQPLARRRP